MSDKKTVVCVGFNGEKTEVPVEKLAFRPSVYGVIVNDDKVLLSSQWDGWDFPGGGMHVDETIDEALEREVREETGLFVKRDKLLYVTDHFFTHPDAERHFHTVLIYFTCNDIRGRISTADLAEGERAYVRAAQWIPLEQVPRLKFYNQVDSPALIKMAAEGKGI